MGSGNGPGQYLSWSTEDKALVIITPNLHDRLTKPGETGGDVGMLQRGLLWLLEMNGSYWK